MRYARTSIAGLLVLVLFFAVALAALCSASHGWLLVMVMMACGLIVLAVLRAALGRGPEASFGVGYAIAAFIYLGMSFGPESLLPSTSLLRELHEVMCPPREASVKLPRNRFDQAYSEWSSLHPEILGRQIRTTPDDPSMVTIFWVVRTQEFFMGIGHCLFSVLFGIAGGLLALRAQAEARRARARRFDGEHA